MELNGNQVFGKISHAEEPGTGKRFLIVTFDDGVTADVGSEVEHHSWGKRRIVEKTTNSEVYILSHEEID